MKLDYQTAQRLGVPRCADWTKMLLANKDGANAANWEAPTMELLGKIGQLNSAAEEKAVIAQRRNIVKAAELARESYFDTANKAERKAKSKARKAAKRLSAKS